jgi:hypothetical protein
MVRLFLMVILAVVVPSIGAASITAAWKVPSEIVEMMFVDLPPPMEQLPGESKFLQPGDKLFDLSGTVNLGLRVKAEDHPSGVVKGHVPEPEFQGDWIVWNVRSEMVVARGSWNDIELAKLSIGGGEWLPMVLRTKFELSDHAGKRTLALVSRSGELSEAEFEGLKARVEPTIGADGLVQIRLEGSWTSGAAGNRWDISTNVVVSDGQRLRLARHGQGESAWELAVTALRETADGTPWGEARALEFEGGLDPVPDGPRANAPIRAKLDAKRWIGVFQMPPDELVKLFPNEVESFKTMTVPENASEWVRGSLLDIHPGLKDFGIDLGKDGAFAGLERMTNRLFVVGGEEDIKLVHQILQSLGPEDPESPIWIETNAESGAWGIACDSGLRASIKRSSKADKDERFFEVEPTRGGDRRHFDLRYAVSIVTTEDKNAGQLVSSTTLIKGQPQLIGSASGTDGKEVKFIVTATDG